MGNANATCKICQAQIEASTAAMRTGCCQSSYHMSCIHTMQQAGGTNCPACQAPLPRDTTVTLTPTAAPIPPPVAAQPVAASPFPPNSDPSFGFGGWTQSQRQSHNQALRSSGRDRQDVSLSDSEETVEEWVPSSNNTNAGLNATSALFIESKPEYTVIGIGEQKNFHAVVTLRDNFSIAAELNTASIESKKMDTINEATDRPPMDIICVLDTSGSMSSDRKLTNLLQAVSFIREELTDKDRMSVITFTSHATKMFNLLKMTPENKQRTKNVTDQLHAGGGTTILSGMSLAEKIITQRTSSNPVTTVFLLTDGQDPSDMGKKQKCAKNIRAAGASLFVFGFGDDHDSAHLNAIADAAEGSFTYIEESSMVIDAFGGVLGAETSIEATNLKLQIDAQSGVKITSAFSGSTCRLSSCGTKVHVDYRNFMRGEQRDILLKCTIPSVPGPVESFPLITASVTYKLLHDPTKDQLHVSDDHCPVKRVATKMIDPNRQRCPEVDVQINRKKMADATKKGIRFADQGNFAQARSTFDTVINEIEISPTYQAGDTKSTAFVTELRKAQSNCGNDSKYFRFGGRSEISEMGHVHSAQRRTYAKRSNNGHADETQAFGLYQNHYSADMQQTMARKKGF